MTDQEYITMLVDYLDDLTYCIKQYPKLPADKRDKNKRNYELVKEKRNIIINQLNHELKKQELEKEAERWFQETV